LGYSDHRVDRGRWHYLVFVEGNMTDSRSQPTTEQPPERRGTYTLIKVTDLEAMKKAIRGLCIELEGVWDAFEYGLRAEISNTNYMLIRQKIEDARAALPQSSGLARAEKES
jgi:hypothetical protein